MTEATLTNEQKKAKLKKLEIFFGIIAIICLGASIIISSRSTSSALVLFSGGTIFSFGIVIGLSFAEEILK